MFCGNCGTKAEDGALFCPNCGSRLAAPAPAQETIQQVTEQVAAPVQEAAQPVYEQVAAPVQEAVQPVYEQVAAPVQEAVQPVYEQVAAPVQEAVQPVYEQVAAPVQEVAQPVYEQVAAPVQEEAQPFNNQTAAPMPAQSFPENPLPMPGEAPAAPVKKKKGKAGLIAGVTAAAVVAGGVGVGYFGFHDKITRAMMGDAGYAGMITKAALKPAGNESENNKAMNTVMSMAADSGMAAMVSSKSVSSDSSEDSGSYGDSPVSSVNPLLKNMTANLFKGGDYREFIKEIFSAVPENSTVTTTFGASIEPGSLLSELNTGAVSDILKKINELKFGSSMSNGATDRLAFTIADKDGALATVEVYAEESGDIILAIPGISERTLRVQKSDIEKALGISEEEIKEEEEKPADLTFDEKEAERIRTEVVKILFDSYNTADIRYTDNVTYSLGEGDFRQEAKGTEVSITLTSEQLDDVLKKIFSFMQNDAYLISYAKDKFDVAEEDYKKIFNADIKMRTSITLHHLVDVHNNVLASGYTLAPDSAAARIDVKVIGTKAANTEFVYTDKNGKNARVSIFNSTKDDGKNGTMLISAKMDANDMELAVKVNYSNVGKAQWLGRDISVGSYSITLADPDKFFDSLKKSSGSGPELPDIYNDNMSNSFAGDMMLEDSGITNGMDSDKFINELKKIEIAFSTEVNGDKLDSRFSISAGEIGSVKFSLDNVKTGDTFTAPDKSRDIDLESEADKNQFFEDITGWAQNTITRLGVENLIGQIGGPGPEPVDPGAAAKKSHYAAYDEYSSDFYADTCASMISDGLADTVKNAVKNGCDSGVIRLYYDDGVLNVLDDAGVSGITYTDSSFDSVYAEVRFDSRVSDGITGVFVALTDDYYDLPLKTPDIFCYIDGVFPWDDEDAIYGNEVGDFICSSYPRLMQGESYTTELPAKQKSVEELNGIAADIASAASRKLGSSGKLTYSSNELNGKLIFIIASDGNGKWTAVTDENERGFRGFAEGFADMAGTFISASDQSDLEAGVYFYNGKFVGTLVLPAGTYLEQGKGGLPTAEDFSNGSFFGWYALEENDYVPTAGYTLDEGSRTVHVGSYCEATKSELKWGDGSTDAPVADGSMSGTWPVVDQYGEFLVEDLVPSEVNMTAIIDDSSEPGNISLTADGDVFRTFYFNKSIYFEGEYDVYPSLMAAEEESDLIGSIWAEHDGTLVLCLIDGDKYTYYILDRGGNVTAGGIGDMPFGEVKENPEISDIVGRWTGMVGSEEITFAVSSNGIMTVDGSLSYSFINPKAGGFDAISSEMEDLGDLLYSAETDQIKVIDQTDNDTESTFIRTESPFTVGYMGDWVLYSVNGTTMEDIAKKSNRKVEDITSYMTISEYDILLSNAEGTQVLVISAFDDAYYVENAGDNLMETGAYNATDDTLVVTQTELTDDGKIPDGAESIILEFRRSL